nr:hypothetical protein [uncultured archaeon]
MVMKQHSFLVDIGKTMVDTNKISSEGKDSQRMYCHCGNKKELKSKARRLLVKKHDTTVEDKHSIETIKCDKCGSVYDSKNRLFLIIPDEDEIYKVSFLVEEKGKTITLLRQKTFVRYDSSTDKLNDNIVRTDSIKFDRSKNKTEIFLEKPLLDKISVNNKQNDVNNITEEVGLSKIGRLEHFFQFYDFASYGGLINIFNFFNKIDVVVTDLDDIKKLIPQISYAYNNHDVFEKTDEITGESITYNKVDSGFGDGKKEEKKLNIGGYLSRYVELSKIFLCVSDFQSISTILLTKGQVFFKEFIHSKNILSSQVYELFEATSPTKILEISMNCDINGMLKGSGDNDTKEVAKKVVKISKTIEDSPNYLKVSPLIYKHISTPQDMEILLSIYRKKYISKTDIETLFQSYDTERIYKFYRNLEKQRIQDNASFTIKNIKHILDRNIDDVVKGGNSDYLHLYTDTINSMRLLELSDNYIYRIKSNVELKTIHDDLAARYGAIKDAKKAEFYKKAAKELSNINTIVGDVELTVIPTLEDLNKEGMLMNHCIYTYLDRIVNRDYMAVHVQHIISNERATLGLYRKNGGLEFDQLKGYRNSRASRELIEGVLEFIQINKIQSSSRNSDLTPSAGSITRMHDYLSDEEVMKIRKEREKKENIEMEKAKSEGKEYVPKYSKSHQKNKKGFFGLFA